MAATTDQQPTFKRVFLVILDGFGLAPDTLGNAITAARMSYVNSLIAEYPAMSLVASSLVVGLPWGQYGNSEVGHSAIGAGRVLVQDLSRINEDISNGTFKDNKVIRNIFAHTEKSGGRVHFIGCTSPGGIHAHEDHLFALLDIAAKRKQSCVVHFISDGRDTGPQEAIETLKRLRPHLKKSNSVIGSVSGRAFAMDRILNWKLTERVWHAIVSGDAPAIEDVEVYLKETYARKETDYDVEPATVVVDGKPVGALNDGDAVFFFDFRNDRMVQLSKPFIVDRFSDFDRGAMPRDLAVATMARYAEDYDVPVAYEPLDIPHTLGEVISDQGWTQWRIAEKEKQAHVTNFFNGGRIEPLPGEQRDIVSSRMLKGDEYLEHPEMSAAKVVSATLEHAESRARFFVVNFANPDMIGHAGDLKATVEACRIVDESLEKLVSRLVRDSDTAVVITADHGNAEELIDPTTGGNDTQHSTQPVPVIFVAQAFQGQGSGGDILALAAEQQLGTLVDIAPTVLRLFGLKQPKEMTGSPLL